MGVVARRSSAAGLLVALALASAGCAAATTAPKDSAPRMGMGGGSASGGMASGVIAMARDASMSAPIFDAAAGTIDISRVLAPDDGWVVVRSAASAGGVLGYAPVSRGENRGVAVRLRTVEGRRVRVALFVDRGVRGTLEFDPTVPEVAFDKPVYVEGAPVESALTLLGWGADTDPNTALVMVEDQKAGATLDVAYLLVPTQSWIEVRRIEKDVPTRRLGILLRSAGEYHRVAVPIQETAPGDELLVTVLADRGTLGLFEPSTDEPMRAIDQPWVSAGVVVSQRIRLR
jgi:hypothetical protein